MSLLERTIKVISESIETKEQLEYLKDELPEFLYKQLENKFKDCFLEELHDFLRPYNIFNDKILYIRGSRNGEPHKFFYGYLKHYGKFMAYDHEYAPYTDFPLDKFYRIDNIGDILYTNNTSLFKKALIFYPKIKEKMLREISPFSNPIQFGKKKKKKKKLSSDIKKKCKKKGIRLTYKRNGKRVYKSEKVLKKQLSNRT